MGAFAALKATTAVRYAAHVVADGARLRVSGARVPPAAALDRRARVRARPACAATSRRSTRTARLSAELEALASALHSGALVLA